MLQSKRKMTDYQRSRLLIILGPLASLVVTIAVWGATFLILFFAAPEEKPDNEMLEGFFVLIVLSLIPGILTGTFVAFSKAGILLSTAAGAIAGFLTWIAAILLLIRATIGFADMAGEDALAIAVFTPLSLITGSLCGLICGYVARRSGPVIDEVKVETPPPPDQFDLHD